MKAVSGKELCRILEKQGWTLKRVHGSHHIFGKANIPTIISVPVHGHQSLKIGLLRSLVKQAGLKQEDLS